MQQPAAVVACAEMWTYQQAKHGDKRQDMWIWTAVMQETDGRRLMDFEVSDRSENTFERRYARFLAAQQYCSDRYALYAGRFPHTAIRSGKGGPLNRNEGLHSVLRSQLHRLMRRTKGHTKSIEALVCQQLGAKSIIPAR